MNESFEEVDVIQSGKRLGVRHCHWMGDWFNSWSPRNDNSNAEGCWSEWVGMANAILAHPLTKLLQENRQLTDEQIQAAIIKAASCDRREE